MCDDYGEHNGYTWEQRMEDAKLIVDAGNTIQKCDLLPSELLNQRDELLKFVRNIASNYDCDSDAHKYNTSCRCCEANGLINRINPNK